MLWPPAALIVKGRGAWILAARAVGSGVGAEVAVGVMVKDAVGVLVGVGKGVGVGGEDVGVSVTVGVLVTDGVAVLVGVVVGVGVGVDVGFGNDGPKTMIPGSVVRATTLSGVGAPLAVGKGCGNFIILPGRDQSCVPPNAVLSALPPFPYHKFFCESKVAVNGQSIDARVLVPI